MVLQLDIETIALLIGILASAVAVVSTNFTGLRRLELRLGDRIDRLETQLGERIERVETQLGERIDRLDDRVYALAAGLAPKLEPAPASPDKP